MIFQLPHIFIVFSPGGSGNFVTNILNKILNTDISDIAISTSGSAHNNLEKKIIGTDYLSFGTIIEEHAEFKTREDREQFYLEKIKTSYADVTTPQVVWTHDYTNIPFYKKHFKNAKILVITHNTDIERLVTLLMNLTKTLLDDNAIIPLKKSYWSDVLDMVEQTQRNTLIKWVKDPIRVEDILKNKNDPVNKSLIEFFTVAPILDYYGMLWLVESRSENKKIVFDNILYPSKDTNPPYIVGEPVNSYIDADCIQLPYIYLIDNRIDILIHAIESVVGNPLTATQLEFVKNTFIKYRNSQNQTLLSNPKKYYDDLKKTAIGNLSNPSNRLK